MDNKQGVIGRIRPGIKRLIKSAEQNPNAKRIYEAGVARGIGFDAIAKELESAGFKKVLVPQNKPYFSVWPGEFGERSSIAQKLMDVYGEKRHGDTEKHLYRFPVVFPFDNPLDMVFERMECYSGGRTLKYRSELRDGRLLCLMEAPLEKDPKTQRVVRLNAAHPLIPRDRDGGICHPPTCPEFQDKLCNARRRFKFYIPKVSNMTDLFEIVTGSFYGSDQVRKALNLVADYNGGLIPPALQRFQNERYLFWMEKILKEVRTTDEKTGAKKVVAQFMVHLDINVEITEFMDVIAEYESLKMDRAMVAHQRLTGVQHTGTHGVQALTHDPALTVGDFVPVSVPEPAEPALSDAHQAETTARRSTAAQPAAEPMPALSTGNVIPMEQKPDVRALRVSVAKLCQANGLDPAYFGKYFALREGEDWSRNPELLEKAAEELQRASDNPQQYRENVDKAMKVKIKRLCQQIDMTLDYFNHYYTCCHGQKWSSDPEMLARAVDELLQGSGDPDAYCARVDEIMSGGDSVLPEDDDD